MPKEASGYFVEAGRYMPVYLQELEQASQSDAPSPTDPTLLAKISAPILLLHGSRIRTRKQRTAILARLATGDFLSNAVEYALRGDFMSSEANQLHAEAFNHRVYEESEWDWVRLCHEHSLGWVTARIDGRLVGFVNVLWDGLVHAWIQDEMVSPDTRHQGIGLRLIDVAREAAKQAGC